MALIKEVEVTMGRKFNKNDRVMVYRQNSEKLAEGIILGWVYDRSEKSYDYLVGSLDGKRRTYFEEDPLELSVVSNQ